MSFFLPKIDAIDGSGFGFDIVIGREPDIGVRLAFGGPSLA
jgi:glycine cleavage system pyridoxal-binding protein P